jgi:anti-sigma factor RsiW
MKISDRDWAQISAYLDGELSPQQQTQIKNRIEADPALRSALDDLKGVKDILRQAPQVPLPRSFVLRPAQLGTRVKERPAIRGFRLAAVVMSFLLVGSLAIDFSSLLLGGAMASQPKQVMLEAPQESADEIAEEPALMAAESQVEEEQLAVEPVATEGLVLEAAQPAPAAEAESTAYADGLTGEQQGGAKTGPEKEATAGVPPAAENLGEGWQEEHERSQATALPTMTEEVPPNVSLVVVEDQSRVGLPVSFHLVLRLAEIVLGLGALGFGTAAWLMRRKDRRR